METNWNAGHLEVLEGGGKLNIKDVVQLTAVSIKLTATRTDILFTYYNMMLFNSIFLSASRSIICFLSFRFTHKYSASLLLIPNATQSMKLILRRWEKKIQTNKWKLQLCYNVKIVVKKV